MKLSYWHIQHESDSNAYSIRARTKKAALEFAAKHWNNTDYSIDNVKKVTVEYDDGFDLMEQCLSEGAGCWEF